MPNRLQSGKQSPLRQWLIGDETENKVVKEEVSQQVDHWKSKSEYHCPDTDVMN